MKIVIIDNYDSFTYNLSHLVKELGADVTVVRNDQFELPELEQFDKIILSPGPGIPEEAGLLLDVIRTYTGRKPMLGVCLGHQAIGEVFGAKLINLSDVYHGVQTEGTQLGNDPIFDGLPERIKMGRYHSWVVDNSHDRRRHDYGSPPQRLRHSWHPVSSRERAHTRRTNHCGQLAEDVNEEKSAKKVKQRRKLTDNVALLQDNNNVS